MSAALIMAAICALVLTSGIALTAGEPAGTGDDLSPGDLIPLRATRISAAEQEQARAAMRERVERL